MLSDKEEETTYDCGGAEAESGGYGKSVAYRESGADRFMLASYKWAPDDAEQIAIGAIQTLFNDTTKDVDLTFAQTVNYPAGSDMGGPSGGGFATRTRITGNSASHAFELKIALVNSGGYRVSVVGKGISQGAGNYFLLRHGAQYYCLAAGATEADLSSAVPTDQAGVSGECTGYLSGVDALTPFDEDTEVPRIDLSDFDLGVAGTPVNYLMF